MPRVSDIDRCFIAAEAHSLGSRTVEMGSKALNAEEPWRQKGIVGPCGPLGPSKHFRLATERFAESFAVRPTFGKSQRQGLMVRPDQDPLMAELLGACTTSNTHSEKHKRPEEASNQDKASHT